MSLLPRLVLMAPAALAATLLYPTPQAHAGLDACGDIYVEAGAECEIIAPSADCETMCTPITVEAQCAAELTADCDAECNESLDITCTETCAETCVTECDVDPGSFTCEGQCQADCNGYCEAGCAEDDSECWASCQATCSAECSISCEVVPPSADCTTQCDSCCEGQCTAEPNIECQVDCQAEVFVDCQADIMGECVTQCETEEGALFCDGQYVDHGGNVEACVEQLKEVLDIDVSGYIDADCDDNSCEVDAGGTFSCGVGGTGGGALAGWGLIGLAILVGVSRRKRQRGAAGGPLR